MPTPTPTRNELILRHLAGDGTGPGQGILGAAYGVGGRVYRERGPAFMKGELPAIDLVPDNAAANQGHSTCRTKWTVLVHVIICVNGGAVSAVADPICADVHRLLLADVTLGGLATAVRAVGTRWMVEQGDSAPGVVDLTYEIDYRTDQDDLTT